MLTPLSAIPTDTYAKIHEIKPLNDQDLIAQRLHELGFISGKSIQVIAKTLFKKGPIVVKINQTRFALRQSEAQRVLVTLTV